MKILVFSDSHRSHAGMIDAVYAEEPQMLIHLGDLLEDAQALGFVFPRLPLVSVPGNCDGWTMEPLIRQFTVEGRSILASHGHTWHVKQGYGTAVAQARKVGAQILLFGHTHVPYCEQLDALWVLNPGPARRGYGVISIEPDGVRCSLLQLE